jgi:TRAP-type mannitol/chloroaromatic compound transport system permease large subunit
MPSGGLWMLAVLAVLIASTGLPVWALLLGVASAFAAIGVAAGAFDAAVLGAVVPRTVNLLEHDLLQAMPLYVFIGVLLQRLPVADALFRSAARLLRPTRAGSALAALAVGTLVAPMNGSVASSASLLSRLVGPRLRELRPAQGIGLLAAAATIGVVVPPSLVLLLLGDAMLRAHTEAANLAGTAGGSVRIINTQDVLHAALVPALLVLVLWAVVAWRQGRSARVASEDAPLSLRDAGLAAAAATGVLLLLGGVFVGALFAVEAAATGGCLLVLLAVATRSLDGAAWCAVLDDALALSGALFALLVGATTFSLVFGVYGTGAWLAERVMASQAPALAVSVALLAGVAACAWVLDAFEMIFVIVPIAAPLLVLRLGDAQQAAVLLLLVLQLSFLLPPLGYAVLIARSRSGLPPVSTRALLAAVAPFIGVQLLVGGAVLLHRPLVHLLDGESAAEATHAPRLSDEDVLDRMREMGPSPLTGDEPAPDAAPAASSAR